MSQSRWRQAVLSIEFTRCIAEGTGSVVTVVVRNEGEAPVRNVRARVFVDGVEGASAPHQGEALARHGSRRFDFRVPTIAPNELCEDRGRIAAEVRWGGRLVGGYSRFPFDTQMTMA
jgi:hypothetical protein